MERRRLTKEDVEAQVSALTPGKGIEAKFYNKGGAVVVTFVCSKGEDGLTRRTFSIGRKSRMLHDCSIFGTAWQKLIEEYKLQPPKELTLIMVSKRMTEQITSFQKIMRPYNHDYAYPVNEGRMQAESLNRKRIQDYNERKDEFCHSVGLRRIKLFLNNLVKNGDHVAKMYRIALEIEGVNLAAKKALMKYHSDYNNYNLKESMLHELIALCLANNVCYGIQRSTAPAASQVIYFEQPDCEQISFHTNLYDASKLPAYKGEWDGQNCSTMRKLESAIWTRYKSLLKEKYKIA